MLRFKVVLGVLLLLFTNCTLQNPNGLTTSDPELQSFQKTFMTSFDVFHNGGRVASRALTPFETKLSDGSRATVPVDKLVSLSFSAPATTTMSNYPEPGQSSSWVISTYPSLTNVYKIRVTTTFASYDARATQLEEYLVQDSQPDGLWTIADPVVNATPVSDPSFRLTNRLTFRDGSYQDEKILKSLNTPDGCAAFPIGGSLDYPGIFAPAIDVNARFSSVVAYTRTFPDAPTYWFWNGQRAQTILGIRYYTEELINSGAQLSATMLMFEKAVTSLQTQGGDYASAASTSFLPSLTVGGVNTLLSESVLRQTITYGYSPSTGVDFNTAVRDTRMKTVVVNISGQQDYYLQRVNDEATVLLNGSGTLYTPTGDTADVLANDPGSAIDLKTSHQVLNSAGGVPVVVTTSSPGTGDLATLYKSIETPPASPATVPNDVVADLLGDKTAPTFSGNQGIQLTPPLGTDYNYTTGSVEAWIYMDVLTNTSGLVHYGFLADFTDELWSLQFMGNQGQLAFSLSKQSPYAYDWVGSKIKLATKKWYYVSASWDLAAKSMKLYINGKLNNSAAIKNALIPAGSYASGSKVVVGSQFFDATQVLTGYYGFSGKINGVLIHNTVKDAAYFLSQYNTYLGFTPSW